LLTVFATIRTRDLQPVALHATPEIESVNWRHTPICSTVG